MGGITIVLQHVSLILLKRCDLIHTRYPHPALQCYIHELKPVVQCSDSLSCSAVTGRRWGVREAGEKGGLEEEKQERKELK